MALVSMLLPEGILEYFDVTEVKSAKDGWGIYLEEKNSPPVEYKDQLLHSKGFYPEVRVQDFPIRGRRAYLHVKRRRWEVVDSGESVSRDWNIVQTGTRMTKEFAAFLKGILG